uniref:Uncharacterized protein n=1 Tax=Nelumbo nucifera TaxID=4432 RepID=A0A822Y5Z2_NELNU|nr:TPA_asm: hypothetical protein HUJ06_027933 [Nelumbo nucifera]
MQHHQDSHTKSISRERKGRDHHSTKPIKFVNLDDATSANNDWFLEIFVHHQPMQMKEGKEKTLTLNKSRERKVKKSQERTYEKKKHINP